MISYQATKFSVEFKVLNQINSLKLYFIFVRRAFSKACLNFSDFYGMKGYTIFYLHHKS